MLNGSSGSSGFSRPSASRFTKVQTQAVLGVPSQVQIDQPGGKAVEPGGDRSVGREDIADPCDRQRNVEGLSLHLHETPRPFEHGERRVALVEMADLRLEAKRTQQAPAADAQDELLPGGEAPGHRRTAADDAARRRRVSRIVAVEQIEREPADLHLPRAEPDLRAGQLDGDADPLAALVPDWADRQLVGIVEWIELLLAAVSGNPLAEVALLVQQTDPDDRDAEIAGRLELIPRHVAESTGVDGEGLAER